MRRRLGAARAARAAAGLTGAVMLLASACSAGHADEHGTTVGGKDAKGNASAPQVTITPGDGSGKARPERGVVVTATGGTLEQVTVTAKGKAVDGAMSGDKLTWRSRTLVPGAAYQVSAVAKNDKGTSTTATSRFKTLKAANALSITEVTPSSGEVVGVGMPITVSFNRPVTDRKAVERVLKVKSAKPAVGAWHWVSGQQVIFRTKNGAYWQARQRVRFTARLAGVKAAKDTYGVADFSRGFTVGDAHIITVNTRTHRLVVKKNGKKYKTWPISAGRGGKIVNGVDVYQTTSGVHLVMAKSRVERMTSAWMGVDPKDKKAGGYDEQIPFAVRISNSGEYIHSMAATVWAQGHQNVSHGCVNSPPAAAEWFYGWARRGDVVTVTGTSRKLAWDNGWSYYQMPWRTWVKGSALDATVTTG